MSGNKKMPVGVMKICSGSMEGKEYYFGDGQVMTVGRSSKCDIKLDESYTHVSREHCSIAFDGTRGRFFVVDTSSKGIFNRKAQKLKGEGYIPTEYTLYLAGKGCKLKFSAVEADVSNEYTSERVSPVPETEKSVRHLPEYDPDKDDLSKTFRELPEKERSEMVDPIIPQDEPDRPAPPVINKPPVNQISPVVPAASAAAAKSSSSGLLIAAAIGGIALIGLLVIGGIFLGGGTSNSDSNDAAVSTELATTDNSSSQTSDSQDSKPAETKKPEDKKPEDKKPEDKKPDKKPEKEKEDSKPAANSSISDAYKNAAIGPKKDPVSTWGDVKVKEIRSSIGIHFYVPSDWQLSSRMMEEGAVESYSCSGGYVVSAEYWYFPNNQQPFDFAEDQRPYELGSIGSTHYFLCTAIALDYDPDSDPDKYCPELSKYRDKMNATAWVEQGAKQQEETIVLDDATRNKIVRHYKSVLQPTGDIVCEPIDDEYTTTGFITAIRYQVSDAEADEIIANGGMVYPNEYCFTIEVNSSTGVVRITDVNPKYDWTGGNYSAYDWNLKDG